jgi:hypothetical protein
VPSDLDADFCFVLFHAKSSIRENDAIVDASRFLSIVGQELGNLSAT